MLSFQLNTDTLLGKAGPLGFVLEGVVFGRIGSPGFAEAGREAGVGRGDEIAQGGEGVVVLIDRRFALGAAIARSPSRPRPRAS
jgi:hypothetical protein